jgi:DNA-binding response OmpR family regulator
MNAGSNRTVLVVDDDAAVRALCRVNLEQAGFQVIEASDGEEALDRVHETRPDLILLDILMPGVSGWQVAADLLNDRSTDQIPIVFISALTQGQDRLRAYGMGAAGYVTKPFDPTTLAPTISSVLDQIDRGERSAAIEESIETLHAELSRRSGRGRGLSQ